MQLAAAVLLQSRLPERERNPISIERNEKWAAILIQYARKFPTDREAAEKDWEMLEQGRRDLERRE
ncbi:hypothetical protein WL26_17225 [Burkholderia cepacia]|nr:hypothetical protein WL26_17225 [Burkholderia cepacia]